MADWVTELRSGEHEQTNNVLKDCNGAHCCLGVLCEHTLNMEYKSYAYGFGDEKIGAITVDLGHALVPSLETPLTEGERNILIKLGLYMSSAVYDRQNALITMNDSGGFTFEEIADVVEAFGWNIQEVE